MPVVVEVWGDGALFTRPEHKAERLTYPVITPPAAVGVLEAIFWKPEFQWAVRRIEVLRDIRYMTLRRNETSDVPPLGEVLAGRRVDTVKTRMQRNAVCLRDVAYRIEASVVLRPHADKPANAYLDQFDRRLRRGACQHQPYLGTREFTAHFGPTTSTAPIPDSMPFGLMLHSIDRSGGTPVSRWWPAQMTNGIIDVPARGLTAEQALR